MFKNKGIAWKFLLAISGVTQILLMILTVIVISSAYNSQKQQSDSFITVLQAEQKHQEELLSRSLIKKGESLADLLAQTGASLVIGYDFEALASLSESTLKDTDVVGVIFKGQDGTVLATTETKQTIDKTIIKDLIFEDETLGTVEVQLSFNCVKTSVAELKTRIDQLIIQADADLTKGAWRLGWIIIGVITVVIITLCSAIYASLSIFVIKPVMAIVAGINESAESVKSSSGQLSGSSQQLADGASQSAASIEETSSSFEEIHSMTRQNAENATECDSLMKEVNEVITQADKSMEDQTIAMEEISKASAETFKIVKTIDEIAFQTNLLALNAAVEAARAGEAGAGFAVVADEVRNLAMRAAKAAQDTSGLIESIVTKVKEGENLANQTLENFGKVAERSKKVGTLINEIAVASEEQNTGLAEVNNAITEIDQVTQQNAASSEEAASASTDLSGQAVQLENYVHGLVALIKGSNGSIQPQQTPPKSAPPIRESITTEAPKKKDTVVALPATTQNSTIDDDFEDF